MAAKTLNLILPNRRAFSCPFECLRAKSLSYGEGPLWTLLILIRYSSADALRREYRQGVNILIVYLPRAGISVHQNDFRTASPLCPDAEILLHQAHESLYIVRPKNLTQMNPF
jgi:hypothetical protein